MLLASLASSPSPFLFTSSGALGDPNLNLNVADALHHEIRHNTITVFTDAPHNLMLDDPTQFAAIVRSAVSGSTTDKAPREGLPTPGFDAVGALRATFPCLHHWLQGHSAYL